MQVELIYAATAILCMVIFTIGWAYVQLNQNKINNQQKQIAGFRVNKQEPKVNKPKPPTPEEIAIDKLTKFFNDNNLKPITEGGILKNYKCDFALRTKSTFITFTLVNDYKAIRPSLRSGENKITLNDIGLDNLDRILEINSFTKHVA